MSILHIEYRRTPEHSFPAAIDDTVAVYRALLRKNIPPMYVTVGTAEILEDDSRGVVKKAQDAGVDVTFEEGLHLMHIYPLFFAYFPEARNSIENINKWIQMIFTDKCAQ